MRKKKRKKFRVYVDTNERLEIKLLICMMVIIAYKAFTLRLCVLVDYVGTYNMKIDDCT